VFGSAIATGNTTNYGDVDNKKDTSIGSRLFVKKMQELKNVFSSIPNLIYITMLM
jgi:hypothetical protein